MKCDECEKEITFGAIIKGINGKDFQFCSENCANKFDSGRVEIYHT